MTKRFTDLNPRYIGSGGTGVTHADGSPVPFRGEIGVIFDCPCGCDVPCYIPFANPRDGLGPLESKHPCWTMTMDGDDFNTMTLSPSIQRHRIQDYGCDWHGFITLGAIIHC